VHAPQSKPSGEKWQCQKVSSFQFQVTARLAKPQAPEGRHEIARGVSPVLDATKITSPEGAAHYFPELKT
jgi:hypothetical protein